MLKLWCLQLGSYREAPGRRRCLLTQAVLRGQVFATAGLSPRSSLAWSLPAAVGGCPQPLWLGPLSPSPKPAKAAGSSPDSTSLRLPILPLEMLKKVLGFKGSGDDFEPPGKFRVFSLA